MPRVLKAGDKIGNYLITAHLNTGAMANAFTAQSSEGRKVFFKQYKSPAVGVKWFAAYVDYQKELNHRVRQPALRRFCVHQLDSFVHKFGVETFFQAYEFVEGGHDLGTILEQLRREPRSLSLHQRTILAKVMMAGIHQLHEHKIAHCDLKPSNLQMLADPTIEAGYQLKLIDMDFSVLSDRRAPWHGQAPYVGTPRYFSPEHLRGETPTRESDIFTCGLILYELLGGAHPYPAEDDVAYFEKVKAFTAVAPKVDGLLADPDANSRLATTIRRCLSPKAADRPSAREVSLALNGKAAIRADLPPKPLERAAEPSSPRPEPSSLPEPSSSVPKIGGAVKLVREGCVPLTCNVSTTLGKALLRQFGNEARFAEDHQFALERRGLEWWLVPRSGTTNYTTLNGEPALVPVQLKSGDRIEIGSRTTGKKILPVTVNL